MLEYPHQFVDNVRVHSASLKVVSRLVEAIPPAVGDDVLECEIFQREGVGANLPLPT